MADITIVNGVYKPTNITGGAPSCNPIIKKHMLKELDQQAGGLRHSRGQRKFPGTAERTAVVSPGNHGEIMGKQWENHGKIKKFRGKYPVNGSF